MPRVKATTAATARMQDRPGRLKLMWRRQRRTLPAVILGGGTLVVLLLIAGTIHTLGRGADFNERLGNAMASIGFRVREVVIEGRQKTPEPLLRAALGVHPGDPILAFSVAGARARLETINWVKSAVVERVLPDIILVRLTERSPIAIWQHDGKFALIDRDGNTVTDSEVATFAGQLPLVVGVGAPKAAAALVDALAAQPTLQIRVTAAVRVGERRWNLQMNNGTDVLLPESAEVQALAKLVELQATHALLDRPLQAVDLRLPDRLVVRPLPDPNKPAQPAKKT
jgi:cell division protein FtsQ